MAIDPDGTIWFTGSLGFGLGASLDALDVAVNETGAVVWAGALTGETTIDGVRVASTASSDVLTVVFAAKP